MRLVADVADQDRVSVLAGEAHPLEDVAEAIIELVFDHQLIATRPHNPSLG